MSNRWDPATEEFVCLPEDDARRFAEGVRSFDFDKTMGPYPLEYRQKWESLSMFISPEVLEKIEPIGKTVKQQSLEYDPSKDDAAIKKHKEQQNKNTDVDMDNNDSNADVDSKEQQDIDAKIQEINDDNKDLESFGAYDGGAPKLFFTTIPKPKVKMGASAEEITLANIDKTDILTALFKEHNKQEDLLGTLRYTFKMITTCTFIY